MTDPVLAGIDIETTGLLAPDHRIVEIHVSLWRGRTRLLSHTKLVDPQRNMPAEAQRVHGISSTDLLGQPTWDMVAPDVLKILTKAQGYVWHNGEEFDGPFIDMELKRIGLAGLPKRPACDTMLAGVWATHDGKKPRLEELCFACGVTYDKVAAHGAEYDVSTMMDCFYKGLDLGFFEMPKLEGVQSAA
jgi:DNA polymerase III subunit epsilon